MSNQIHISDKIDSLDGQADELEERVRTLRAQAKLAAQIKEQFPGALYTVQPSGASGYVDRSINAQTHGAIKRHTFIAYTGYGGTAGEKRYAFYYELTTKIGREKVTLTSEILGWISSREIETILDAASSGRKRPATEVEVTPTTRQ